MPTLRTTPLTAMPDLAFVADGGDLVRAIEAYLAAQPLPQPRAVPLICRYGQTAAPWDQGMTAPTPTLMDRLRHRAPAPTPIDTATHLRLVSRYLTTHGWCQNLLWDPQGRRCLLGAQLAVLQAGYGTETTALRARTLLMEQFTGQVPGIRSVDEWNDAPGRTPAQVHRQLDIAASRAHHRA